MDERIKIHLDWRRVEISKTIKWTICILMEKCFCVHIAEINWKKRIKKY